MKLTKLSEDVNLPVFKNWITDKIDIMAPGMAIYKFIYGQWKEDLWSLINDHRGRTWADNQVYLWAEIFDEDVERTKFLGCPFVRPMFRDPNAFHDEDDFGSSRLTILVTKDGVFNSMHDPVDWWPPEYVKYLVDLRKFIIDVAESRDYTRKRP